MTEVKKIPLNKDTIVPFIEDIFLRRGSDSYLGEEVTMSEHMLQGALLAEKAGADEELVAAALLHDIGHYTSEFPEDALENGINNHHDEAGASVLSQFFPRRVVDCVRYHVDAKRYLCAVDPGYFDRLSDASIHTLNLQGGPMSEIEVIGFRALEYCEDVIQVRIWDEEGKVKGVITPEFSYYVPLLQRVIDRSCDGQD
ncbi:MAG: HD domain-containing protein [Sneathiellales bacterium]|nr:HD domain-containing protein [Sneathiellales bacterium]